MPIVVYKLDASPASRPVNMVVELLGLKVEEKVVNTLEGEQFTPEFIEKNPLHKVPVIEDGDFVLSDSHAIITYLVSKYGADKKSQFLPNDVRTRAVIDQRLFYEASILFKLFFDIAIDIRINKAKEVSKEHVDAIKEASGVLEKYLQTTKFVAADQITVADISIVSTISTFELMVPIDEKYPRLVEWLNTIKKEDWYKKGNEPGLAASAELLEKYLGKK